VAEPEQLPHQAGKLLTQGVIQTGILDLRPRRLSA